MEALLIDEWLGGLAAIPILDDASIALARERVREVGAALPAAAVEPMVLVASELARNQLRHASGGRLAVRAVERDGVGGLEVVAADRGDGIANPREALAGTPRASGSLGVGLAAACELAFETDIDVRLGEGTCVLARRFASEVPKRRSVGIFGRPFTGERRSGDHAAFVRDGDTLVLAICDGLGHGEPAREAADGAMETVRQSVSRPPDEIIEACDVALRRTRGVVMSVMRLHEKSAHVAFASVGNIGVHVYGARTARRFGGSSFVVGSARPGQRIPVEIATVDRRETIVFFTDGVPARLALEDELDLLRQHPVVVAHEIVQRYGRADDDVLVLVAA